MKYCTACKAKYDDSVSFCAIDGEVLEADPASIVNTVLDGQYQMEALLGKGGIFCSAIRWPSKCFRLKSGTTPTGCGGSGVKVRRHVVSGIRTRLLFTI